MDLCFPDDGRELPSEEWRELYGKVEGQGVKFPWYLLPFRWRGQVYDLFVKQRSIYAKLVANREVNKDKSPNGNFWHDHWRLCCQNPAHFIHHHFFIRDKESQVCLFDHWNRLQRKLYWCFMVQWVVRGRGVRIDVLKARQVGASTLVEALLSWRIFSREDQAALLMSNKKENAKRVFSMMERFYKYLDRPSPNKLLKASGLPPHFIPMQKSATGLRMEFGDPRRSWQAKHKEKEKGGQPVLNSMFEVLTAGTKSFDVGFTAPLVHLTELALWPNPEEVWENMAPGIPKVQGTAVIRESVAWVAEDWWHKQIKFDLAGESDFELVFSGWQEFPHRWSAMDRCWKREYSMDLPDGCDDAEGRMSLYRSFPEPVKRAMEEHDLDLEQAYWMMRTCKTDCNGSWDSFRRQYPLTPSEAFRAAGRSLFTSAALEYYLEATTPEDAGGPQKPPVWVGNFALDEEGLLQRISRPDGKTKIWVEPSPGQNYVVGADAAEGQDPDGDFSVADVWCVESLEQVAQICFKLENPRFFAYQIHCLAKLYNDAFTVPESTGSAGFATTDHLSPEGNHPVENLYVRERPLVVKNTGGTQYGYHTGGKVAKRRILYDLRDAVDNREPRIHSYLTARQWSSYIQRSDGTYGNAEKKKGYDDAVIAAALAWHGLLCDQRLQVQTGGDPEYKLRRMAEWAKETRDAAASRDDVRLAARRYDTVQLGSLVAPADQTLNRAIHPVLGEMC